MEKASSDISVSHYSLFDVSSCGWWGRGGGRHVATVSGVFWRTILAFFNWAVQSLVYLWGGWQQAVRGKSSVFNFDEHRAFYQ